MSDARRTLGKTAEAILAKAEECHELAKVQHKYADAQHQIAARLDDSAKRQRLHADAQNESAYKLDTIGSTLIADAVEVMGQTERRLV
jgi:hypothetical protein